MTIRIVTDSACDLPQQLVDQHRITIVPLSIRFGDKEYIDRKDLTKEQFWQMCSSSPVLPETAAPSPGQFETEYRRLKQEGATGIVVVSLSSDLSATMQSAELAARAVAGEIDVRIVDSRSASIGEGITAVACAKKAAAGATIEEVVALGTQLAEKSKVWGALDTLENLKKGGRIGGAKAMLASALSIKPIIEVRGGKVEEGGKQRTRSKALAFLVEKVRNAGPIENLSVLQAQCDDLDVLVGELRKVYSGEIIVGDIGPVIGAHTGAGTIGVAYHHA
ncbi:MAG: DegV family protein [Ilumatobacteraceae bacterium]|jgi:DegV family protein with EDD domain